MAEFPALPLWTDAWVADTHHLTRQARGTYHDLLVLMWRTPGCKVPNDDGWLSARMHMTASECANELRPLINEFCRNDGNWITQKRLLREFAYVRERSQKQSVRAKARWGKEKDLSHGNAASGNAASGNAPTPTPTPLERNSLVGCAASDSRKRGIYSAEFEEFWKGYPTDRIMSKKKAFEQWRKLSEPDRKSAAGAVPAFRDYCRKNATYRPVHAERFLSQRRFEGFEQTAVDPAEMADRMDRADRLMRRGKYADAP